MKVVLPALLLVAAGAAAWLFLTRSGPTYEPPSQDQIVYAPAPTVLTRAPAAGELVQVLDVEGMCCQGCTGKLHARLLEQPGVHVAAVDLEAGTASALVAEGTDPGALAAALCFEKYVARPQRAE